MLAALPEARNPVADNVQGRPGLFAWLASLTIARCNLDRALDILDYCGKVNRF